MYTVANTLVTILRGVSYDDQGDIIDAGSPAHTNVPAQINAMRIGTYGIKVFEPGTQVPSTVRLFEGVFPSGLDIVNTDQVVDQSSQRVYAIVSLIDTLWENLQPDLNAVLKRVTAGTSS